MKKSFLLTLSAVCLCSVMFAQPYLLSNNGATLVIEPGAVLVIEGGMENVNGGTVNNAGTLEVQGDFLNSATWDSPDPNTVIFSGGVSADITSGGAVFDDVDLDKDAGFDINLLDNMTVKGDLTFVGDNNKINIDANDLVIQGTGSIQSSDANEYVVTGGVGYLRMEGLDASETFVFPVGNDNTTYNPATLAANGGHTSDEFSVRVTDNLYLDGLAETEPATEGAVDAMWEINEGTAGGSDVDVTLQWAFTDQLTDFPTEVGVSRHDGTNWDLLAADVSAPTGTDPYTQIRNNVTEFSAFAVGGEPLGHELKLSLTAFLQGAYAAGLMGDALRAGSLIPTDEPYADSLGYVHTGFGGDETVAGSVFMPTGNDAIVDWVVVEVRDMTTPSTILASRSGLIQRDGDIVDLDGTSPLVVHGLADGNYHVAVLHRNHLTIRTASAQALSITPLVYDFASSLAQAYDNPAITGNDAMVDLGSGVFGLWGGDVNRSNNVIYNGGSSDRVAILTAVGSTTPNVILPNIYAAEDVNMNGEVKYNGSGADRLFILNQVVGSTTPSKIIAGHQ